VRLSGRVCANYAWTEAKCVAWRELNRNCESYKCTFLAFVVVVELGSLSSDMLIVGRDVAGMDGSGLISNDGGRHWDVHQVLRDGLARFERGQTSIFSSLELSVREIESSYWIFIRNVEGRRNADIIGVNCESYKYKTNVRDRIRSNSLA
jgi:hypothetical protein